MTRDQVVETARALAQRVAPLARRVTLLARSRDPWVTAGTLAFIALASYVLPPLGRLRPVTAATFARRFVDPLRGRPKVALWARVLDASLSAEAEPVKKPADAAQPAASPSPSRSPASTDYAKVPAPTVKSGQLPVPAGVLDVPEGSLDHFIRVLERVQRGEGICRIAHFGDSPITGDLISGEARAHLQRAYGDAGHGFLLPARPWEWYGHLGVDVQGKGWRMHSPMMGHDDRLVGLSGVCFEAKRKASATIECAKWVKSTTLDVYYLARPEGGTLTVAVDEGAPTEIATRADEEGVAQAQVDLGEDIAHDLHLETKGDVTLFGLALERNGPGVIYDSIGANGGAIFHLASIGALHWMDSVRLRRPDLVILAYGTNESGYYDHPGAAYRQAYRVVVERLRQALPGVSILVMGPMDRGERRESGEIGTMESLKRIVAAQREVARELGCAFFDTYKAMGGEGSALRWYESSPQLMTSDFTHPTRVGADRLARMLVQSLRGYVDGALAGRATPAPSADLDQSGTPGEASPEGGEQRE